MNFLELKYAKYQEHLNSKTVTHQLLIYISRQQIPNQLTYLGQKATLNNPCIAPRYYTPTPYMQDYKLRLPIEMYGNVGL